MKIAAFVLMVVADQLSKLWAVARLEPIRSFELLPGILHLTYTENTGAAFSMLQGKTAFLIVVPILACIAMVCILASGKIRSRLGNWALLMVLSGAVGNLIDRIFRGAVVDFFEIRLFKFAIFNVADIFVTVGAVLLFVYILFFSEDKGKKDD